MAFVSSLGLTSIGTFAFFLNLLNVGHGSLTFQRSENFHNVNAAYAAARARTGTRTNKNNKNKNNNNILDNNNKNNNNNNNEIIFVAMPETLESLKVGDQVTFPLPDWVQIVGVVTDRYDHPAQKSWTVIGDLLDTTHGTFTLACSWVEESVSCVGNVRPTLTSTQYELRRITTETGEHYHAMSIVDTTIYEDHDGTGISVRDDVHSLMMKLESEESNNIKDHHSKNSISLSATTGTDTNDIVDILVVYTPDARIWAGGVSAMELLIEMAIDESNHILSNSGVSMRFRLVHQTQTFDTSYQDPSSGTTLLYYMTFFAGDSNDPDGILDAEQALRETYNADLVVVISGPTDVCGVGWLMFTNTNRKYAVSLTAVNCMVGYYTFAHEIGHNMGSHHDASATGSRLFPYSQGWCWDRNTSTGCDGSCMRSVMAYASCVSSTHSCTNCPKTLYYSTPNVVVHGGIAGNADTADNARSLNYFRTWAQNFRLSLQPGGMIFSVEPSSVPVNTCVKVTISGWRVGTGSDINSVQIGGVEVFEILSQTQDSVVVVVTSNTTVSSTPLDVVVKTSGGMVTTLSDAFSFVSADSSPNVVVSVDFESAYSPLQSTGELGWYLHGSPCGDPCEYYGPTASATGVFTMVDVDGSGRDGIYTLPVASSGSCVDTLISVSLKYFAFSAYSWCFSSPFLHIEIQTEFEGSWVSIASASTVSATSTSDWNTLSTSIEPTVMYGFRIRAITYSVYTNCDYNNPVALDNIVINYQRSCDNNCGSPTPSRDPTFRPSTNYTLAPTQSPTQAQNMIPTRRPTPSRPTFRPSRDPTIRPSRFPSREPTIRPSRFPSRDPTIRPSRFPSREPTIRPSRFPSREPTLRPTRSPTTFRPTRFPTTLRPTRFPTTLRPTRFPITLRPTREPTTFRPTRVPTTFRPTRIPTTFRPTRTPSITLA